MHKEKAQILDSGLWDFGIQEFGIESSISRLENRVKRITELSAGVARQSLDTLVGARAVTAVPDW